MSGDLQEDVGLARFRGEIGVLTNTMHTSCGRFCSYVLTAPINGDMSVALHVAVTDKSVVDSYSQTSLGGELVNSVSVVRFTQIREGYLAERALLTANSGSQRSV